MTDLTGFKPGDLVRVTRQPDYDQGPTIWEGELVTVNADGFHLRGRCITTGFDENGHFAATLRPWAPCAQWVELLQRA